MALDGDLVGKIVSEWARTEIQKRDILNYNGAMLAYTDKARIANLLGLSDDQKLGVTPFPSPTTIAIGGNQTEPARQAELRDADPRQQEKQAAVAPPQQQQQSDWWKYLVAAVAASGVTLGGMALNKTPTPVQQDQRTGSVDLDMVGFPNIENTNDKGSDNG